MSDSVTRYADLFEADTHSVEFKLETLILGITHAIDDAMQRRHMSRADLARELDVSPPMVTKILNGTSNFTLRTLVKVSHALECEFTAAMAPCGQHVQVEFVPSVESPEGETKISFDPLGLPSMPMITSWTHVAIPAVLPGVSFYEYKVGSWPGERMLMPKTAPAAKKTRMPLDRVA